MGEVVKAQYRSGPHHSTCGTRGRVSGLLPRFVPFSHSPGMEGNGDWSLSLQIRVSAPRVGPSVEPVEPQMRRGKDPSDPSIHGGEWEAPPLKSKYFFKRQAVRPNLATCQIPTSRLFFSSLLLRHLYELDQHLDRFLKSASMAKIQLPFDQPTIKNILTQTAAVSKCMQGSLRYWLSPGPGDFQLSPSGCLNPALYAIVIEAPSLPVCSGDKVVTSTIPMKPLQFAVMKNVNYLPNALSKMQAEENGAFAAIWLDDEGFIAEGPNMNVAFVTKDRELIMPLFDKILSGCTAKRVLVLAEELLADGRLSAINTRNVTVQEGKAANEMMLIGSGILVKPVLQWDEHPIGSGKEGPVAQALFKLILDDMKYGPPTVRIPVPY
ncbi:hypothetical protein ZIOFF_008336 [Zingiber officinale]|uniref:Uncharacterized protein n=1 Tax=Zingiber officinale TaxID=94328 RepID=A0A8J5IFE0_ZINOF|nr:hypothetical protein ZIOFF_008336 [Zingiber officinale]